MTLGGLGYSPGLLGVIIVATVVGIFVQNWTALNLARALYDEAVEIKQKLFRLTLLTVVLHNGFIYSAAALNGFRRFSDWLEITLIIPNPLLCVVVYIIITKLWPMQRHRLVNIMRHVYLYTLMICTTGLLISRIFIDEWGDYNYQGYIIESAIYICMCILLYQIGIRLIKHKQFNIRIPNSMPIDHTRLLTLSFAAVTGAYLAAILMLQIFKGSIMGDLIVAACLALILACDITLTYKAALKYELDNKSSYIGSLVRTVDRYIHLRQDFEKILETYDSYLEDDDLDAIAHYHESLMGKTTLTLQSINVAQKISQNPSLVAMLLKKIDYADQMNVSLHIPALCSLEQMYIDDFDLGRLLGNLLNNAIEAAAVSSAQRVTLSITQKNALCKLITIANSTADTVDIDAIMNHGATTKDAHMGIGLTQVRNIARKYEGCLINFDSENNEFTVYIELRM